VLLSCHSTTLVHKYVVLIEFNSSFVVEKFLIGKFNFTLFFGAFTTSLTRSLPPSLSLVQTFTHACAFTQIRLQTKSNFATILADQSCKTATHAPSEPENFHFYCEKLSHSLSFLSNRSRTYVCVSYNASQKNIKLSPPPSVCEDIFNYNENLCRAINVTSNIINKKFFYINQSSTLPPHPHGRACNESAKRRGCVGVCVASRAGCVYHSTYAARS
jgi:hypothetical protein